VLGLQPDGELNARARILVGDIENERGNFSEAARTYETVSVVIDEETITPQALEKAVEAYKAAGREADAKRLLNTLRSRYPEYLQKKTAKS
jgi:TolA-binding protein